MRNVSPSFNLTAFLGFYDLLRGKFANCEFCPVLSSIKNLSMKWELFGNTEKIQFRLSDLVF